MYKLVGFFALVACAFAAPKPGFLTGEHPAPVVSSDVIDAYSASLGTTYNAPLVKSISTPVVSSPSFVSTYSAPAVSSSLFSAPAVSSSLFSAPAVSAPLVSTYSAPVVSSAPIVSHQHLATSYSAPVVSHQPLITSYSAPAVKTVRTSPIIHHHTTTIL